MTATGSWKDNWKFFFAVLWPLFTLPIMILGKGSSTANCGYAVAVLAGFWMTEALPIPVTSLMPMVLYPMLGIQSPAALAPEYMKDSILMFVAGLIIALAIEFCGLHKRVALRVILFTGTSMGRFMLGIMLCTSFLSMWMSNTAVAAMMVPIILVMLEELEKNLYKVYNVELKPRTDSQNPPGDEIPLKEIRSTGQEEFAEASSSNTVQRSKEELSDFIENIRKMFLLSCCYSSNIGGTGVITGSGTNLVALEFLGGLDPAHHGDYAALTFTTWMAFNFVPMTLNLALAWAYLDICFLGCPSWLKFWKSKEEKSEMITPEIEGKLKNMLQESYDDLGNLRTHEKGVLFVFLLVVASWILHDPRFIPGWSSLFTKSVSVSTSGLAAAVLFFMIPRNTDFYEAFKKKDFTGVKFQPLLEWSFIQERFPWGVVILLGGGYAMSNGAKKSGLSAWIGVSLKSLAALPPYAMLGILSVLIGLITNIASNTATASIAIPILLELSKELNVHPLYFTLPAAVVCSYAFILPVATPPNAIVYAASGMNVMDMIKPGLFLNIACIVILYFTSITYGDLIFQFSSYSYIP